MHPNAQLIETLYTAIANRDAGAIAACYADDATFEDIAFRRHGRKQIHEMWRLVCHAKPKVTFGPVSADDWKGTGRWNADYMFGATSTDPGRRVVNELTSEFTFRGGLIATHHDTCDAGRVGETGLSLSQVAGRCVRPAAATLRSRPQAREISGNAPLKALAAPPSEGERQ